MAYFRCRGVPAPTPTPTPSEYLYNWDLTQSLVDSVQGSTLIINPNASRNASGVTVSGWEDYIAMIPTNSTFDLLLPNKQLEIDFGYIDYNYGLNNMYINYYSSNYETPSNFGIVFDSDSGLTINTQYGVYVIPDTYDRQNKFENSTFKIITSETSNHNIIWDIYKDNTLVGTTPEYAVGTTPFFDIDNQEYPCTDATWVIPAPVDSAITISGIRLKNVQ